MKEEIDMAKAKAKKKTKVASKPEEPRPITRDDGIKNQLLIEGTQISARELLKCSLTDLSVEELHMCWSILEAIKKEIGKRQTPMKKALLESAESHGEKNDNGSFILDLGDLGKIKKIRTARDTTDPEDLKALLRKKRIPLKTVFTQRTIPEQKVEDMDERAVKDLVDAEKITVKELAGIASENVTWVYKYDAPSDLALYLKGKLPLPELGDGSEGGS